MTEAEPIYRIILAIILGWLGASVGSFLNVLIWRLPRNESIAEPPSHCPSCNQRLGLLDLVPLLSFLFLGAKCRYCGARISWRYFWVELLTAALWVGLFAKFGIGLDFWVYATYGSTLIAMALIDLEHYILPPQLTFGAILVTYIPLSVRQLGPGSGASPAAFQTALFLNGLLLLGVLGIWIRGIPRRVGAFFRAVGFACAPAGGMLAKQYPDAAKLVWFAIGVAILLGLKMYPDDDGSEIEESGEPEVEELGRREALKCIGVAAAALIAFVAFWIVTGVGTTQVTYLNFDSLPVFFKEIIQAVVVSDSISGMMLSWLLLIAFSYGVTGVLGKVAMGGGDLALIASVGAAVGLGGTLQTLLLACIWGILTYGILCVFFGRRLSRPIPFGPFLVAGVITVIFTREWAIEKYLSWLGLV